MLAVSGMRAEKSLDISEVVWDASLNSEELSVSPDKSE